MTSRRSIIYTWICPYTGNPVYVGKTSVSLKTRIDTHRLKAKRRPETRSHIWLRDILARGDDITVVELETCRDTAASYVERQWIAILSERFVLLNTGLGGEGGPCQRQFAWTEDVIRLLGTISDQALSSQLGCNRRTIAYQRDLRGIPPFPEKPKPFTTVVLLPDTIERLGKEPDYLVAKRLGVSKFVIAKHRKLLGIPPCAEATGRNGRIPKGFNRYPETPPEIVALLGTMTDEDLAKIAGMSKPGIAAMRRRLGVPSYASVRDKTKRQRKWAPHKRRKANPPYSVGAGQPSLPFK